MTPFVHGAWCPCSLIGARGRALVTCAVVAEIRPVSVAVVRRIAMAGVRRITVAVRGITVAVRGTIRVAVRRIRIIGPCKGASDERAYGEAAKRRAPPATPPARIRRGGRGNSRGHDRRRCESDKRFPHGIHLDLRTAVLKREFSRNVPPTNVRRPRRGGAKAAGERLTQASGPIPTASSFELPQFAQLTSGSTYLSAR